MIHINIVNYEEGQFNGILSKFAKKLHKELSNTEGIFATISKTPVANADINHHVNYLPYKKDKKSKSKNSLMITHIWEGYKLNKLREGMETADLGICMSDETRNYLIEQGFDEKKLVTILPAHDGNNRRFQIVAILTNVYPDGCKQAEMLTELAKILDKNQWAFRIMGKDWTDIIVPLVADGLQVDYFADFDYDTHQRILESSDYCLYFGKDEGSMAILDAKNAGLKLIAPNVGFHQEIGIDYPFDTQEELNAIFEKLSVNPVKDWTWNKYADKHLEQWKKLA